MLTEERGAATLLRHTGPRLYITFNRGPVRCGTPSVSLANAMHGAWAIALVSHGHYGAAVLGRVVGLVAWDARIGDGAGYGEGEGGGKWVGAEMKNRWGRCKITAAPDCQGVPLGTSHPQGHQ